MKNFVVIGFVVVAAAVGGGLIFRGEYPSRQSATRDFTVDVDFPTVRKVLVRTEAAKQIVTMGGDSEFVDQSWQELGVDPGAKKIGEGKILNMLTGEGDWRLELVGDLQVRTLDEYIGEEVITLKQQVEITPQLVDSHVQLQEAAARLKHYEMTTRFSRNPDGQTQVELSLEQEILTDAPWFAHGIADRRVRASVEKTLANQENAIRDVIQKNKDDVGLFPLQ